jgi:hypothetical protein
VIPITVISRNFAHAFAQTWSNSLGGFMTKDEFDTAGIPLQCRQPDPSACYERLTLGGQSEDEPCLRCPVASWAVAMVFSRTWTNAGADWSEPDSLEGTDKAIVSFPLSRLAAKAA